MRALFLLSLCLISLTVRAERIYLALAGDLEAPQNVPALAAAAAASLDLDRLHGAEVYLRHLSGDDLETLRWLDTTRDGRRILLKLSGFEPTPLVWDLLKAEGVAVLSTTPAETDVFPLLIPVVNHYLAKTGAVRLRLDGERSAAQWRNPLAKAWALTDRVAAVDILVKTNQALLVRRKGANDEAEPVFAVFGDLLAGLPLVEGGEITAVVGIDAYAVTFSELMTTGTGERYEASPWRWVESTNAMLWAEKHRQWSEQATRLRQTVVGP